MTTKIFSEKFTVVCMVFLFFTFYYSYSQVVPVVVSSESASRPPNQVPEDAISLTFRGDKARQSLLAIEAIEFNNGKEVKEGRRSASTDVKVEMNPGGVFLLNIYEDVNGAVRASKTNVGKYTTVTKIDPDAGGNLKCIPLGARGDVYNRNVAVALIYDAAKVEGKEIELKLSDANSVEKNDVEYVKSIMADILEHYYIIIYNYVLQ